MYWVEFVMTREVSRSKGRYPEWGRYELEQNRVGTLKRGERNVEKGTLIKKMWYLVNSFCVSENSKKTGLHLSRRTYADARDAMELRDLTAEVPQSSC